MRANRAMWVLAMVVAGTVVSARAEAAGTINPDVVRRMHRQIPKTACPLRPALLPRFVRNDAPLNPLAREQTPARAV